MMSPGRAVPVIRVKLGNPRPAPQPDPLGRQQLGWHAGLSTAAVWDRGRGVWKANGAKILEAELLLIAAEGIVQLVGTVDGVTKHGDRLAVVGTPLPSHPLVGMPDPTHNESMNPVAYGHLT